MDSGTVKNILGVGVGLQGVALLGANAKMAQNALKPKAKFSPKKIVKMGVGNIVGVNLLKAQSDIINGL